MSSVKVQGNASGTGIFTITSPNSNNTQTLTLPDATTTLLGSNSTQVCQAWVNFAGATGTRNASYNVSSVTRNGAGDYTVNFTSALSDANYSKVVSAGYPSGGGVQAPGFIIADASQSGGVNPTYSAPTASAFRFMVSINSSGLNAADPGVASVAVFR